MQNNIESIIIRAILFICILVALVSFFIPDGRLTEKAYISALEDYTAAMADYTSSLEDPKAAIDPAKVAHEILCEADVKHDDAFIQSVDHDKGRVRIYYHWRYYVDTTPTTAYRYVDIALGKSLVRPERFIKDYFTPNAFCRGYGYAIEWEFEALNSHSLKAYLVPDDEVVENKPENYQIMMGRPLVETDCGLVDLLRESLPFKIKEDECFFVLDTHTRRVGWFYFRSTYNGVDFVGAYEVSGWDSDTTYEELMTAGADNFTFLEADKTHLYIELVPG